MRALMDGRNAKMVRRYYPRYRSPKLFYQDVLNHWVRPESVWLDIGCGKRLCADERLNAALPRRGRLTVGCDRDPYLRKHSSIQHLVRCDAAALPFRSGTFNLVTAAMVLEHLERPDVVFAEVARISQPGGAFVVFTPNRWNYAMVVASLTPFWFHLLWKKLTNYFARGEWRDFDEDVFPTWYRANTVGRLRRLMHHATFETVQVTRLSLAHSLGFIRPLYALSLLFERLINRLGLDALKADILGVFVRREDAAPPRDVNDLAPRVAAAGGGRAS
jgi:ubiquinone/menaquinone biosynthesis C-methylase UbiE